MTFIFTPVRKARPIRPSDLRIIQIAEQSTPEIQRAFLRAIAEVRNGTVLSRVRDALERGDIRAAFDAIPWEQVGEKTLRDSLPQSLRDVYERAGRYSAKRLGKQLEVSIRFDVTNPRATEYIRQHTAQLIREFGQTNRQTIQHILQRSFNEGIPPAKTARMIRDTGIGLTTRQHIAVENFRRRLENDPEVDLNQAQIDSRAERYANRLLRHRTETIARTETISASVEGQKELWREARDEGLIDANTKREWIAVEDGRTDDICLDLDGEQAPLDGTYPGGIYGPPVHPNCRCAEKLVFEDE
jgi:SPP1 gp7 family putative phage head morphogenesis protein